MNEYQIIATIGSIDFKNDGVKLKGVSKYSFEANKQKVCLNIFEHLKNAGQSVLKDQNTLIQITASKNAAEVWHLLNHAFIEKKQLMFGLDSGFAVIEVSHVSA